MDASGYDLINKRRESVAAALHDTSVLIGEIQEQPVQLNTGDTIIPGLGMKYEANTIEICARDVEQGIFKVIVMGEFKNGKSTLLNALLGEKVLPAKTVKATAVITCLVYGSSGNVTVYENGQAPRVLSLQAFNTEFQLTKEDEETLVKKKFVDRFKDIEYAQVECEHPFCANGVRLVDSPGLADHMSRTKMVTNFLQQSHAIILVLNATKLLSLEERNFINANFRPGKMSNVFVVVNRINQIDEDDILQVQESVQYFLRPFFVEESGGFDYVLYQSRVFFVNAKGALTAREKMFPDKEVLEESGVPAFERELEHFLTSEDKIAASFSSVVQTAEVIVAAAHQEIIRTNATLEQPLAELEKHRVEAERGLRELQDQRDDIEETIMRTADIVTFMMYGSLQDHVTDMERTWPQDSEQELKFKGVDFPHLALALIHQNQKRKIEETVKDEMKQYLEIKLNAWAENVPMLLLENMNILQERLHSQIEDFQLKLDNIKDTFSGIADTTAVEKEQGKGMQWFDLLASLGMLNLAGIGGAVMGKQGWGNFLSRTALHLGLVVLAVMVGGPVAWIGLALVEVLQVANQQQNFKKKLRTKLGEEFFPNLRNELPAMQEELRMSVRAQFTDYATQLTDGLQAKIDDTRTTQEKILQQRQSETNTVENSKQRLASIDAKLASLLGDIRMAVSDPEVEATSDVAS